MHRTMRLRAPKWNVGASRLRHALISGRQLHGVYVT
jgi:hypothetical protein